MGDPWTAFQRFGLSYQRATPITIINNYVYKTGKKPEQPQVSSHKSRSNPIHTKTNQRRVYISVQEKEWKKETHKMPIRCTA